VYGRVPALSTVDFFAPRLPVPGGSRSNRRPRWTIPAATRWRMN